MKAKMTLWAAAALATCALFAQTNDVAMTPREKFNRLYGGLIMMPGSQKGKIVIVNEQNKVDREGLGSVLKFFKGQYAYNVRIEDGKGFAIGTAVAAMRERNADVAIFVVDDPALPPLLTSPEEHWACVNVRGLDVGAKTPVFVIARTRKMILRALAYLAAGSSNDAPLVNALKNGPSDLDLVAREAFPADVMIRMNRYLGDIGVTKLSKTTYMAALQAGHDIAPTNEYQKAIWDKVHNPPEKPLKITYDKDKQKPVVK